MIIGLFSFAGSVEAAWWNPTTWFQSNPSQDNSSQNQELLQRVQDLENKVAQEEQSASTTNSLMKDTIIATSVASSTTIVETLQAKVNSLVAQNNSLQTKLISVQGQLTTVQNDYAMCKETPARCHDLTRPLCRPSR